MTEPAAPSAFAPENRERLMRWAEKFNRRVGVMLEEFTAEDLAISRTTFGENYEKKKPAVDLFTFGAYAAICAGVDLDELVRIATLVRDEHAAGTLPNPDDVARET